MYVEIKKFLFVIKESLVNIKIVVQKQTENRYITRCSHRISGF